MFITGRHQSDLDKAVAAIGGNAAAIQGDTTNLADLDRVYATVKAQAGRIDVLAANAGSTNSRRWGRSVPRERIKKTRTRRGTSRQRHHGRSKAPADTIALLAKAITCDPDKKMALRTGLDPPAGPIGHPQFGQQSRVGPAHNPRPAFRDPGAMKGSGCRCEQPHNGVEHDNLSLAQVPSGLRPRPGDAAAVGPGCLIDALAAHRKRQ